MKYQNLLILNLLLGSVFSASTTAQAPTSLMKMERKFMSQLKTSSYTVDCDEDGWIENKKGNMICVNEVGTYMVDDDGIIYFTQQDGLYGWWKDTDSNYDAWICEYFENKEDDNGVPCNYLHCEGDGYEDETVISWESYSYYFEDGSIYEYSKEVGTSSEYDSYVYIEDSDGYWYYGESSEDGTYYTDSDGYWYADEIGDITHGEDNFGYYWKSTDTGGAIYYTKEDDYVQYSNHEWDDDMEDIGMWGWDSEGTVWERDGDYNYDIFDVDGYESYYDEDEDLNYLYNEENDILFVWDEDTHHLIPLDDDGNETA